MTSPQPPDERPLSALLGDLTGLVSSLVRREVRLAQAEMKYEARRAGRAAGTLGGAGGAGYLSAVMLSFALAWGLAELIPTWVAFLVVGLVHAVVAGVLYVRGRRKLAQVDPYPRRVVESLKKDVGGART